MHYSNSCSNIPRSHSHQTPAYASGYLANQMKPRLFMTTHMSYDPYVAEETVAEVREHWKGPFHFGAPDGIVVNVTKDQIWVREGALPDFPNSKAPQQDFGNGQLIIPMPPTSREKIQNQEICDQQLDPALYYPKCYTPELLEHWPADADLVVLVEMLPESLMKSMGDRWRLKVRNNKILEEQAKDK